MLDPGQQRLQDLLQGRAFPTWIAETTTTTGGFHPAWTTELQEMCDAVISNTLHELEMSQQEHDIFKAKKKLEYKEAEKMGLPRNYERQEQGWLDRRRIWDRACKSGAVGSIVIMINGMSLDVSPSGWVDREAAAVQVKIALLKAMGDHKELSRLMLDVVCSKSTADEKRELPEPSK